MGRPNLALELISPTIFGVCETRIRQRKVVGEVEEQRGGVWYSV